LTPVYRDKNGNKQKVMMTRIPLRCQWPFSQAVYSESAFHCKNNSTGINSYNVIHNIY